MSSSPFLAQYVFQGTNLYVVVFIVVLLVAMLAVLMLIFAKCFVRCPSNRLLVIYGRIHGRNQAMCLHGGARFVVPLFQAHGWLSLEPMDIDIPLRGALTFEGIHLNVPSVFTVAIGTQPEQMQNAAVRLMGLTESEIRKQVEDIIFGHLRQAIASSRIDQIYRDRGEFLEYAQKSIESEISKIGLVLINVNIREITDDSGYLDAVDQSATAAALLEKVLSAYDGSVHRLVGHLLEQGMLNEEDRREIRHLLDTS